LRCQCAGYRIAFSSGEGGRQSLTDEESIVRDMFA